MTVKMCEATLGSYYRKKNANGEYVGRLTSDTAEHPLGVYFFTSADKSQWYYYDVLTGEAADDYHSSYEPA